MSVQEIEFDVDAFLKKEREDRRPQVVGPNGETHGEFEDAFELIQNPENWKLPIDSVIPEEKFGMCSQACSYFTGSELQVLDQKDGNYRVVADGYYVACPEV